MLFDLDYSGDGGFVIASSQPGTSTGQVFEDESLRDCTLDAELGLVEGDQEDRYGLYFRQSSPERYVACTISAAGHLSIGLVDGGPPLIVAGGPLAPDIPFERGLGAMNRLTIVACGPMAVIVLNGVALTGVALDPRYVAGYVGALLVHTSSQPQARLAVNWAQARAILVDQPAE